MAAVPRFRYAEPFNTVPLRGVPGAIASADPQTLPPVFFNNVTDLGRLSLGAISGGFHTLHQLLDNCQYV